MSLIPIVAALTLGQVPCPQPDATMLALSLQDFDQTEAGWRSLASKGCEARAADAIARYRSQNAARLVDMDTAILNWHEGQLRASAGQTEAAIAIFEAGLGATGDATRPYHEATIAFLKRDRAAFDAAYARLLALPEPEAFARARERYAETYPDLPPLRWPLNQDIVEGLAACFDRPYREAYACDTDGTIQP